MNRNIKNISKQKERDVLKAERLRDLLNETKKVAFICCSYDTSFESIENQVIEKVHQLVKTFGLNEKIVWSLWVVDDLPEEAGFGRAVQKGFSAVSKKLGDESRLKLIKMRNAISMTGALKGRALLDGMSVALKNDPDLAALVYMNLNLKVDARFSTEGLMQVLCEGFDASIGTRHPREGGTAVGRGLAGNIKSWAFNALVRLLLKPINCYYDTNAPMKVYNPAAAKLLIRRGVIQTVGMDCDWLMLLHLNNYEVFRFPIVWSQRLGSRVPWHMVLPCFMDVLKIRKRWKMGKMNFIKSVG